MVDDPLSHRIAAQYRLKQSTTIADVPKILAAFEHQFAEWEHTYGAIYDRMLQAKIDIENLGESDIYSYNTYTDPETQESAAFLRDNIYRIWAFPESSFKTLQHKGLAVLYLGILQQYDLPPQIRRKVEAAARFWAKTRINRVKKDQAIDAFGKIMGEYESQIALVKDVLTKAKLRSSTESDGAPSKHIYKAGPFSVINTGGFDEKTMETVTSICEKAAHIITSKGFGKVCYGDILVSKTLSKASVLAFYMVQNDEMFIRANLKNHEKTALFAVIHELGHRLQFQFLKSNTDKIKRTYNMLAGRARFDDVSARIDPALEPKPGETIDSKGTIFEVTRVKPSMKGKVVELVAKDEPAVTGSISLLGWLQKKGIKVPLPGDFVSQYASTDASENFAEMFYHHCIGTLTPEQEALFREMIE